MPKLLSSSEAANLLQISRVALFKKIKSGDLRAKKVGRNYVIREEDFREFLGETLSAKNKGAIDKVVEKAATEYEEVFRRLGRE